MIKPFLLYSAAVGKVEAESVKTAESFGNLKPFPVGKRVLLILAIKMLARHTDFLCYFCLHRVRRALEHKSKLFFKRLIFHIINLL